MKIKFALIMLLLSASVANAQVNTNLPNAMAQFVDGSGAPYASGQVYTYVPGTTTPKTTWQDPYGLILPLYTETI